MKVLVVHSKCLMTAFKASSEIAGNAVIMEIGKSQRGIPFVNVSKSSGTGLNSIRKGTFGELYQRFKKSPGLNDLVDQVLFERKKLEDLFVPSEKDLEKQTRSTNERTAER